MPVLKKVKPKGRLRKKTFLKLLVIIFTVVAPAILLLFSYFIFVKTKIVREELGGEMVGEEVQTKILKPSQVLENKNQYMNKNLILRGRISQAPMICDRRDCPKQDPCCGCKAERNLIITDPDTIALKKTTWQMRLLDEKGRAFCQRVINSCDYRCPGWQMGDLYKVRGTFFAEPPPRGSGWRLYFDFYFQVNEKEKVKAIGPVEKAKMIFQDLQKTIKNFKTSGQYVLP